MAKVNPIQLQKYLKGLTYPASKKDITSHAKRHGADANVLSTLEQMMGEQFKTPADVSQAAARVK